MPEQRELHPGYADRAAGQWAATAPPQHGPFNDPSTDGWGSEGPGGLDGHMQDRMRQFPTVGGALSPRGGFTPQYPGDFGANEWLDHERRLNQGGRLPTQIGGTLGGPGVGGPPAWAPAWGYRGGGMGAAMTPDQGRGKAALLSSLFAPHSGGGGGMVGGGAIGGGMMTLADMLHGSGYGGGSEGVRY